MFRVLNQINKLVLKWWQAGIYEISMIALGIFLGARFSYFFEKWVVIFLVIFLVCGYYIFHIWHKQTRTRSGR